MPPVPYTLFLRREASECFRSVRGAERHLLERFFDALQDRPGQPGDAYTRDEVGRRLEIKYLGRFRVIYWTDEGAKEVKVLKLEALTGRQSHV